MKIYIAFGLAILCASCGDSGPTPGVSGAIFPTCDGDDTRTAVVKRFKTVFGQDQQVLAIFGTEGVAKLLDQTPRLDDIVEIQVTPTLNMRRCAGSIYMRALKLDGQRIPVLPFELADEATSTHRLEFVVTPQSTQGAASQLIDVAQVRFL